MSKYGLEPITQGEEIASLRAALERHGAHKCATYAASLQAELDRLRAENAELWQLLSEVENCVRNELLRPNEGDTVFLCRAWIDATRKALANDTETKEEG